MKKKLISILLMGTMLLAAAGCGAQDTEGSASDPDVEKTIEVNLEGYSEAGGILAVSYTDEETAEYDGIGMLAAEGETIGDVFTESGYESVEPKLEGDVFEGWLEYTKVSSTDEDGFESTIFEFVSEDLYSTEELFELTVPDHAVNYVAKWAGIALEDYFKTNAWDNASTAGSFSFSANGGSMSFYTSDGDEYESAVYTYWLEDNQALNEIMGTEGCDGLIGIKNEGKEFAGWTLYEADSAFWNSEPVEEDGITSFLYDTENEDVKYLILTNATVIREASPTEEICALASEGRSYYAEANWK